MERIGVLLISYGSRGAAIADALKSSQNYDVHLYVVDKCNNPFNRKLADEHVVSRSLNVQDIVDFAVKHSEGIDFGIVGPEGPIISGVRNRVEAETDIPMICPRQEYALEGSKVQQRQIVDECCPELNPKYRVFDPWDYESIREAKEDLWSWIDEIGLEVAVKPDKPATGKGVGVWGDHFNTRKGLLNHFLGLLEKGSVLVEEKVEGEEFSLQFFCDGHRILPTPAVRDYKRAFDEDKGPNTGGMGSYKSVGNILPFMSQSDYEEAVSKTEILFRKIAGGYNPALIGVPFYMAFTISRDGLKLFEINSRPGDPEIQCLLPILKDDFVEICLRMIDGNLRSIEFENLATVTVYKVPPSYGGKNPTFQDEIKVNLRKAEDFSKLHRVKIYPGALEERDGKYYALKSRTICAVGIGEDIEAARKIAYQCLDMIEDAGLWYRGDIASKRHIQSSILHIKKLRQGG